MKTVVSSRSRGLLALCVSVSAALSAGCQRHAEAPKGGPPGQAAAKPTAAAAPVADPTADARYVATIRGIFSRHGCDAGVCHGTFKGGGFALISPLPDFPHDYQKILERIDRQHPAESILLKKGLGQVPHSGGKNLADDECDTRRLLAWIGNQPEPACQPKVRRKSSEDETRFAREVAPALVSLGCAQKTCHGTEQGPARDRLDLTSLTSLTAVTGLAAGKAPTPAQARPAYDSFMKADLNQVVVWNSGVIKAAMGDSVHTAKADVQSCAFRRLYGFLASSPEATCPLGKGNGRVAGMPGFDEFAQIVMPALVRRGCTDGGCHGGGNNPMSLFDVQFDARALVHDYLALTARIEDPRHPEQSTFLRTVRNQEPHGGGQRLGGKGDCVDDLTSAWLHGRKVVACGKPTPPSWERFVTEVQPVLDKMTCTQQACHGGGTIPSYRLIAHASNEKALRSNYEQTSRQIDYDFMPFSQVMLRMREPCAYDTVGSWIVNKPKPNCVIHDPDPAVFPKLEKKLSHQPGQKT